MGASSGSRTSSLAHSPGELQSRASFVRHECFLLLLQLTAMSVSATLGLVCCTNEPLATLRRNKVSSEA